MDEMLIRECVNILASLEPTKPWMTARGLARRLGAKHGAEYTVADIERVLVTHTEGSGRSVRHSHYPSKKTLDLLWGHVDVVGEKGNLAELRRLDAPDRELAESDPVPDGAPWHFLSHNHRDFGAALEIRKILAAAKHGAWLFETDIAEGGRIASSVQAAIGDCDGFLAYVTRRSIGSLWVQKEIEVARRGGRCRTHVIIDGTDAKLRRLFATWTGKWPPEQDRTNEFCALSAVAVGQREGSAWARRGAEFMHSLHEFVGSTGQILAFPPVPESALGDWVGARLSVESLRDDRPLPASLLGD